MLPQHSPSYMISIKILLSCKFISFRGGRSCRWANPVSTASLLPPNSQPRTKVPKDILRPGSKSNWSREKSEVKETTAAERSLCEDQSGSQSHFSFWHGHIYPYRHGRRTPPLETNSFLNLATSASSSLFCEESSFSCFSNVLI
jgi:hypothetical protein